MLQKVKGEPSRLPFLLQNLVRVVALDTTLGVILRRFSAEEPALSEAEGVSRAAADVAGWVGAARQMLQA